MKKFLAIGLVILCVTAGATGWIQFKKHRKSVCASWVQNAQAAEQDGYYATAIDQLTLYFSEKDCRGRTDPSAIELLARARPFVPLPGGGELKQQLSLSRLGWRLDRNSGFQLTQAKAALAMGDWRSASEFAAQSPSGQSSLIRIAALVRLEDWDGVQTTIDEMDPTSVSSFQRALLSELLVNAPLQTPSQAIRDDIKTFARLTLKGRGENITAAAHNIKDILTDEDLTIAVALLASSSRNEAIVALLDQPQRPLPNTLLKRLAFQFWSQKNYPVLTGFSSRKVHRPLTADTLLLMCLAERELAHNCSIKLETNDYSKRYGKYSAEHWGRLFNLLNKSNTPAHEIVDALVAMEDLVGKEPVVYQLLATLYQELNEPELADRFKSAAALFGLAPSGNWHSSATPSWTAQLRDGYMPTTSEVDALETVSPDQSILWRLVRSRLALATGTDEGAAEALRIVRPVLGWAPEVATAQLIAASSTAHFGDHEASYGHLMNAVSADPKSAVAALRLSLHFYQQNNGLSAMELTHWWESISRAEVGTSDTDRSGQKARKLLIERALILAGVAEEEQDDLLAKNAYRSILKQQPDNHVAMNNLAVWLAKEKHRLEEARKLTVAAITLDPSQREYQLTLKDIDRALEQAVES